MLNQSKATPRPWKVASSGNDVRIYNDEKFVSFLDSEDNASLIVKAVNNHEQLLEACCEAYRLLDESGEFEYVKNDIKKAIEKAERK